jgi:hypothetical protein
LEVPADDEDERGEASDEEEDGEDAPGEEGLPEGLFGEELGGLDVLRGCSEDAASPVAVGVDAELEGDFAAYLDEAVLDGAWESEEAHEADAHDGHVGGEDVPGALAYALEALEDFFACVVGHPADGLEGTSGPEWVEVGEAHGDFVEEGGDGEGAVVCGGDGDRLGSFGGFELVEEEESLAVDMLRGWSLGRLAEHADPEDQFLAEDADRLFHAEARLRQLGGGSRQGA